MNFVILYSDTWTYLETFLLHFFYFDFQEDFEHACDERNFICL